MPPTELRSPVLHAVPCRLTVRVRGLGAAAVAIQRVHQLAELEALLRRVVLGGHAEVADGGVVAELERARRARTARLGVLRLRTVAAARRQRDACAGGQATWS